MKRMMQQTGQNCPFKTTTNTSNALVFDLLISLILQDAVETSRFGFDTLVLDLCEKFFELKPPFFKTTRAFCLVCQSAQTAASAAPSASAALTINKTAFQSKDNHLCYFSFLLS